MKSVVISAFLLCLPLLSGAVRSELAWTAAGALGVAAVSNSVSLRLPKLVPVRSRSQKGRN